ncbi:glycosyltransferase family 4 protein [Acidihalobacter prosperus]|uniref:Glycosyltransferase n=1 Tax=Acidihalobacter prosperus TaxID=160660 RepID=A0A1A6C5Y6_9GAMM|nr:glycosyltransferase family 4 protein [Acidihalobacter prosperus]OBS09986.1 Glycosyltransferase [Acidihalobacter prosperus]
MTRIAVVHDWLTTYAGAERVLEQILQLYPQADLFSVCDFLPEAERAFLGGRQPKTTFIQKLPGARRRYRSYLSLMPLAIEQLDLSSYDLVISSSHAVAKGVLTGPDQVHVSYVYTPLRYAWDLQHQYLRESGMTRGLKSWLARYLLHRIRQWDVRTANGVDVFVTSSSYIARRIRKAYRRDAIVVPPPVDIDGFAPGPTRQTYYLTASRLVPYKRVDLIVSAFARMPGRSLKVVGAGPEYERIAALAAGHDHIEMLGYQGADELAALMGEAKAFVFAAEEDFGIAPVEAQAAGAPVIAYGRGGARETVVEGRTGLFFEAQTPESLIAAVERFELAGVSFSEQACRTHAEQFSVGAFRARFAAVVEQAMAAHDA